MFILIIKSEDILKSSSLPTLLNLCNALGITHNFLFADLISKNNNDYDNVLFSLFSIISPDDKEIL